LRELVLVLPDLLVDEDLEALFGFPPGPLLVALAALSAFWSGGRLGLFFFFTSLSLGHTLYTPPRVNIV
jgi:hypothetical protein